MKKFTYKAKDRQGQVAVGEVEAGTIELAARLVRARGLVVISLNIKSESLFSLIERLRTKVTNSDISTFTRQFATMINAGLPITEALNILRSQSKSALMPVVNAVLTDIEGGSSLSDSLARHPKVFSRAYIALVKSGEAGGVLDSVLVRLADNLEKEQEFKGKVVGAMVYPIIIIIGMIVVSFIMMIFVIPKLLSLFKEFNAKLPFATQMLIYISDFFVKAWPLLILLIGGGYWGFTLYQKTPRGRRKIDELKFKIPIAGDLIKEVILTELTRTLSLMVGAGVSIIEALNITSEVVDNAVISEALDDAAKMIERGFPIAYSFAKHPEAFPYLLSQMVAVGEETGKMDEVLSKVSRIFEIESDQKVKALTTAIEPIVMIVLGLGVGFLVIAIILPIYNLTSSL